MSLDANPEVVDDDSLVDRLSWILAAPADLGVVELLVRRPAVGEREVVDAVELSADVGVVGDNWSVRPSRRTPDGSPHPLMQVAVINARVARAVAGDEAERRALVGDQLHLDLDLSVANLPTGTRLAVGSGVIEITDQPHTGCPKFAARFGSDALRFATTGAGRDGRFRGVNARVLLGGTVRVGDTVVKLPPVA